MPGARWDKGFKLWTYPATPGAARAIHEHFKAPAVLVWEPSAVALLVEAERIAKAANHKTADDLPAIPLTKTEAWQHQRVCFWYVVELLGGLPE